MKIILTRKSRGFTLIELMVSMVITVILLTILFNVTALSSDNFTRAKGKLKMSRVADQVFDQLEIDIASAVIQNEDKHWFYAGAPIDTATTVGLGLDFPNATSLVFYTAAIDKYDGIIGVTGVDLGGDVSIVNYKQNFVDPLATLSEGISELDSTTEAKPMLFREIFSPNEAFDGLIATIPEVDTETGEVSDVRTVWKEIFGSPDSSEDFNFSQVLGDGVYGLTTGFELEFNRTDPSTGLSERERKIVFIRPSATESSEGVGTFLNIGVGGVISDEESLFDPDEFTPREGITNIRVKNMILSLTLLDEVGMNYISRLSQGTADVGQFGDEDERRSNLIKEHGFTFARVIPF